MWQTIVVLLIGFAVGFVARMIQHSFWLVSHSDVIGTLNIVKVGTMPEDILLELEDGPEKLKPGFVLLRVIVTRR